MENKRENHDKDIIIKSNINKAVEYEKQFGYKQEPDIIKKRMDSDLFKGGMR